MQLAPYVGPFSQRAAQIERSIAGYEAEWAATHPGEVPGPALRRAWDARAWADARPDKVIPQPGADLHGRWLRELAELGYRDRDKPIELTLDAGRCGRSRPRRRDRAGPPRCRPVGVERRRHPRPGRTADRRHRRHHRRGGAGRPCRRPDQPACSTGVVPLLDRDGRARAHPRAHLTARPRRRGRHCRAARGARRRTRPPPRPRPGRACRRDDRASSWTPGRRRWSPRWPGTAR